MDYISTTGSLGLATRLRRLLEQLLREGRQVYETVGVDFEVRWFAVFHLLTQKAPLSVTEVSNALGQSHPTVIQVVDEMTRHGLLSSKRDDEDGRRRQLELTAKGRKLAARLKPVWHAFAEAGREATTESGNDFFGALEQFEAAIGRLSMYDRIIEKLPSVKTNQGGRKRE